VDWYLEVLRLLNVPVHWDFTWLPERPQVAAAIRSNGAASARRWMIIQPGARWVNKRWPVEYFTALAEKLIAADPELRCAILGGPEDRPLGEAIARVGPARCLDLTGKLSLPEMVEWIRLADGMVTNDTGPMHVAAALGKPVVALFGPTEPRRTGPYRQIQHALQLKLSCVPCMKSHCTYAKPFECLRALTPAAVFAQINRRSDE
jgi:lipopolysaccharide heptosyltransferase II